MNASAANDTPSWWADALRNQGTVGVIDVDGVELCYYVWEPSERSSKPPVLLLHGTSANAHWWAHVASLLSEGRRVVAIDLSGHGASGHRDSYNLELWADEVMAVADVVDPSRLGVHVVGHSLGGDVAAVTAARSSQQVLGIVMCETIRDPRAPHHIVLKRTTRRYYPTFEAAVARFQPLPSQRDNLSFIVDHLARKSIVSTADGWTWRHDTGVAHELQHVVPRLDDLLDAATCPMALIRSQRGEVSEADADELRRSTGGRLRVIELAGSGHHPMLDRPIALTVALLELLEGWSS